MKMSFFQSRPKTRLGVPHQEYTCAHSRGQIRAQARRRRREQRHKSTRREQRAEPCINMQRDETCEYVQRAETQTHARTESRDTSAGAGCRDTSEKTHEHGSAENRVRQACRRRQWKCTYARTHTRACIHYRVNLPL